MRKQVALSRREARDRRVERGAERVAVEPAQVREPGIGNARRELGEAVVVGRFVALRANVLAEADPRRAHAQPGREWRAPVVRGDAELGRRGRARSRDEHPLAQDLQDLVAIAEARERALDDRDDVALERRERRGIAARARPREIQILDVAIVERVSASALGRIREERAPARRATRDAPRVRAPTSTSRSRRFIRSRTIGRTRGVILAALAEPVATDRSATAAAGGDAAIARARRVILAGLAEPVAADRGATAAAGHRAAIARAGVVIFADLAKAVAADGTQ